MILYSGLSHDNTWIGLNDRTVEDDFQWTDKMDLVSVQLWLFCLIHIEFQDLEKFVITKIWRRSSSQLNHHSDITN